MHHLFQKVSPWQLEFCVELLLAFRGLEKNSRFLGTFSNLSPHRINEIKHASIDDGKDIHDHDPVDTTLPWTGRFQKSLDLLNKTYHDCSREEDDPGTRGLQRRILGHIDAARHFVHRAMDDAGR